MPKSLKNTARGSAVTREVMSEIFRQSKRASEVNDAETHAKSTGARQDILFVLAMLACLILTGLNVTGTMPFQTVDEPRSGSEIQRMAYQTVNFAVREIDAYRRQHGSLPETLTDVGAPTDPRWNYQVLDGDRYMIRFEAQGFPLAYDSRGDPDEFFATVRRY